MAASQLDLINTALVHLGEPRVATTNDTQAAINVNANYSEVLRDFLRDYEWGFATKRAELTAGILSAEEALEWTYVYNKPADWLATIRLSQNGQFERSPEIDFEDEGNRILCGSTPLYMKYIFEQTDVTQFDATFDQAFPIALALKSCYETTQSATLQDRLADATRGKRLMARNRSAQDQRPQFKKPGRFRRARQGGLRTL